MNPALNKKVKKYLDAYFKGTNASSPEAHHAISFILQGALTDANFHSTSKKVANLFPKAKKAKYFGKKDWENNLEDKGADIASMAKWDGHDILDSIAFFVSMYVGGPVGKKISALKNEAISSDKSKMMSELRVLGEEVQQLEEKNCPTNPSKWSYYKGQAKKKFDVYPSAYANGWASKQYKAAGGGWKSCKKESVNEIDTKKANLLRTNMPGYVGPKFAKKASDEDILAMADLKDQKARIYNRYVKVVDDAISKLQKKYRIKESLNEGKHDKILDQLADIVKGAKSFMDIGKELKKNGIKYSFGTNMIPMYIIDKPIKIAILNKKYADGAERTVGDTAIGVMESLNEGKVHFQKKLKSGNIFQVIDRDTKGMRGTQDKFHMQIVDKKGKVIKDIGSHPSLDGAKKYSNSIKEYKHRFGKHNVQFQVSARPNDGSIVLIAKTSNDLDSLQNAIADDSFDKADLAKSLEKKLRIPIEVDYGWKGAGYAFKIDLYSLVKMVK